MTGSDAQWSLLDALEFAWKELRLMPLSISDPLAARVPPALDAVRTLYGQLEANAAPEAIAMAKRAFAKEMTTLVLFARSEVEHKTIDRIYEGIREAGADLGDWN